MLETVAYIDAGTGSYLLAALAGGAATFWFFLKSSIARLSRRGKQSSVVSDYGVESSDFNAEGEAATER